MNEERFDIYTRDRRTLNKTARRGSRLRQDEYHLVVMGMLVNSKNEILITKRSQNKPGAGKWECTSGSVLAGETSRDAIQREIKEELGIAIEVKEEIPMGEFFEDDAIFDIWKITVRCGIEDLVLQESEVDEAKIISINDIKAFVQINPCASSLRELARLYDDGLL
jgi:8-oxo-dGTP diphosphatase